MQQNTDEIRSAPCGTCAVCGSPGKQLYHGLQDRLFSAPGNWSLSACRNSDCGLIWPDPMPLTEDLGKAYLTYYTHASQNLTQSTGLRRKTRESLRRYYWSKNFGYNLGPFPFFVKLLASFYYLSPIRRREAEAGIRCLPATPNGRLLDVGCGSGDWLLMMRDLGWHVAGNDFDSNAVQVGAKRGLQIGLGALEQQNLPNDSFNAITLSHVIEHVPDPLGTIRECLRILKPGGRVILLTPNGQSLSHQVFKSDWRGLEPPRHLHIFSLGSMANILTQAGFQQVLVRPFIVTSVIYDSLQLRWGRNAARKKGRHWLSWIIARLFKLIELGLIKAQPRVGDCLIATAEKPGLPPASA